MKMNPANALHIVNGCRVIAEIIGQDEAMAECEPGRFLTDQQRAALLSLQSAALDVAVDLMIG
jgi:Na+-translocating ferredoxin:NAD+ oxidoreductase RNF subunit RnfB